MKASESSLVGPKLVQTTFESVFAIRRRLIHAIDERILTIRRIIQEAQSRQKKYVDIQRTYLKFQVGDYVILRMARRKGLQRVPRLGKLALRYVEPFKVFTRIGLLTYRIELPPQLVGLHLVFHVSMPRKADVKESKIVDYKDLEILSDVSTVERLVQILDWRVQILRGKVIQLVMVLWSHQEGKETT